MTRQIQDSFIDEYLRYTSGQESPELFHIWVAMVLIATMLERDVYLDRGYYKIYPNLYVILVAGTSKCHKSVAINMGVKNLLPQLEESPPVFAQKITNERLIQFLGDQADLDSDEQEDRITFTASGLIAATELSTFLGKRAMDTGIITTLTDLYDSPDEWKYETKTSGTNILQNTCINMIGASTGKWLRSAIPTEAVGGGFISRSVFVYQNSPKRLIAFPEDEVPETIDEMESKLVNDLAHIQKLEGRMTFTPEAKQWYTEWYKQDAKRTAQHSESDFFTRWSEIILKIAMILSVAQRDDLVIRIDDLKKADEYLEQVRSSMSPVINQMTVADSEMVTSKILGIIRRRGTVNHESLVRYASKYVKTDGLKAILETLDEAGAISIQISQGGGRKYIYKKDLEGEDD